MIYANNAGTSWPKPSGVARAVEAALAAPPDEADATLAAARGEVCGFLGIEDPDRFLFTTGCTSALAVALGDLPWQEGDVVLTSALEHHALVRPVQQLVAHRGVRHEVAPYRPGQPVDLDAVRRTLRGGHVRVVAISAASNVTGELLPVEELAELAHRYDALCLVDAAQTVGVVPVDVRRLGADILAFAGHKGPLGPQGIGGLWAAPHVRFASPRAACEIGAAACAGFPGPCDVGSVNLAGAAGLAAGLRWLRQHPGGEARTLAVELARQAAELPGCTVLAPEAQRTATVSLRCDALRLPSAEPFFAAHGVVVRAGQHCAPMALQAVGARDGTVRISFGPHTTREQAREVARVVELAARGNVTV